MARTHRASLNCSSLSKVATCVMIIQELLPSVIWRVECTLGIDRLRHWMLPRCECAVLCAPPYTIRAVRSHRAQVCSCNVPASTAFKFLSSSAVLFNRCAHSDIVRKVVRGCCYNPCAKANRNRAHAVPACTTCSIWGFADMGTVAPVLQGWQGRASVAEAEQQPI
jgi:hypothetical protein